MLYKNKYRIASARLKGWDYSSAGAYFITICTHRRIHHFGHCENGKLQLSTIGLIVQGCWFEIPRINPQVELGAFVVMPNHVHGIIILPGHDNPTAVETGQCPVSTKSISTLVGSYKSACTKHINRSFPDTNFKWQERFHDHIIRDQPSFDRISKYIINNPNAWNGDRFYGK